MKNSNLSKSIAMKTSMKIVCTYHILISYLISVINIHVLITICFALFQATHQIFRSSQIWEVEFALSRVIALLVQPLKFVRKQLKMSQTVFVRVSRSSDFSIPSLFKIAFTRIHFIILCPSLYISHNKWVILCD